MFYKEVFEKLNRLNVRYLVVGGVAVNLYGIPRMTYDLDIMVALDKENIHRLWKSLTEAGFMPRVPVTESDFTDSVRRKELIEKKNMLVISFFRGTSEFQAVDFFINNPIDFESCYQRRNIFKVGDVDVPAINIQDLIEMKTISNRKHDIDDIESLKRLFENLDGKQ